MTDLVKTPKKKEDIKFDFATLTKDENILTVLDASDMRDAIFARACDYDPNTDSGAEAAKYTAYLEHPEYISELYQSRAEWRHKAAQAAEDNLMRYKHGVAVLSHWTMKMVARSTVYQMADGSIPGAEEGEYAIRVEAGHTANTTAYNTYVFSRREEANND